MVKGGKTMRIYIPTYRRTDRQKTLLALPPHWQQKTTLVVDNSDAKILRGLANRTGAKIWIHPKWVTSIAKKRAFILSMA